MKTKLLLFVFTLSVFAGCTNKTTPEENQSISISTIDSTLHLAAEQYEYLGSQIEPGEYPKTYYEEEDELETSGSG